VSLQCGLLLSDGSSVGMAWYEPLGQIRDIGPYLVGPYRMYAGPGVLGGMQGGLADCRGLRQTDNPRSGRTKVHRGLPYLNGRPTPSRIKGP